MGTCQHRQRRVIVREYAQIAHQRRKRRRQDVPARIDQHQSMRQIIDVLRSAGEMDELGGTHHFDDALEAFLQPIFDGLDIVIGSALDSLDPLGVGNAEVSLNFLEKRAGRGGKRRHLGDAGFVRDSFEPCELDTHALAHESEFAEMVGQNHHLGAITAVQRRQCSKWSERVGSRHDIAGGASKVYHNDRRLRAACDRPGALFRGGIIRVARQRRRPSQPS